MSSMDGYDGFYNKQYMGNVYANSIKMSEHPFYDELIDSIEKYDAINKKCLEIGSGRGALQDVVDDYTGVDYANTVEGNYHKSFINASASDLPIDDNSFDFVWTYAVLEHVPEIEKALEEMIRVSKNDAVLIIHPAWHCRRWAANGYQVRSYSDFDMYGKMYKFIIPLLDSRIVRMIELGTSRVWYWIFNHRKNNINLKYERLKANYDIFWQSDSDACNNLDQLFLIMWFESRGHECISHLSTKRKLLATNEGIAIRIKKCTI